jgi:hypothetical protein
VTTQKRFYTKSWGARTRRPIKAANRGHRAFGRRHALSADSKPIGWTKLQDEPGGALPIATQPGAHYSSDGLSGSSARFVVLSCRSSRSFWFEQLVISTCPISSRSLLPVNLPATKSATPLSCSFTPLVFALFIFAVGQNLTAYSDTRMRSASIALDCFSRTQIRTGPGVSVGIRGGARSHRLQNSQPRTGRSSVHS